MSIQSASIPVGATFAPTGGSATTFLTKNTNGGLTVLLDDSSTYLLQKNFEFSVKEPKVNTSAPNGYTQQRNTVVVKVPLALDNGSYTMNTVRIEIASDIETTDAEKLTLREYALHLLSDSDYTAFWDDASLS